MEKGRARAALLAAALAALIPFSATPAYAIEATLSAPGASEDLQGTLRAASSLFGPGAEQLDTVQELLAASRSDYRTLVQVLYDAGYFGPTVSIRMDGREVAAIPPLNPPSNVGKIEILVDTGPAFRFGTARVAPIPPSTKLPKSFESGKPASTGAIIDAAAAGQQEWRNIGHAKATVGDQNITANHSQSVINADIELVPGPELRFGKLKITGETDVHEDAIRRIAGFPSGDKFSPDEIQDVGSRLRRTGTFSTVAIKEAEVANPDGTLDFEAEFEDLPKRHLSFGVEISSNEGLDLSADWMHRNLFGNAEKLRFEARISNIGGEGDIDGRIGIRLDRPDTFGPDDSTYYLLEAEVLDEEHYKARQATLGAGVRREFSDDLFGEAGVALVYVDSDDAFGSREFVYFGIPAKIERDKRNDKVSATSGNFLSATVMPFAGIKSMPAGLHMSADGRYYRSLDKAGRFVLAGRVQLGSVIGPDLDEVPPTLLFFSGGAGSVRGHPYESLGIPVAGGIAGGKSYAAVSAEIRGYVTEKIALVGFYDFGMVGAESYLDDSAESHAGAGIGVRYDLGGFGPLRLDIATPVSGDTDDGIQFYIGIGQAF
ncbi:MAG: autotransporter assembly complex protein TamA [Paracoccaceae bacterium]